MPGCRWCGRVPQRPQAPCGPQIWHWRFERGFSGATKETRKKSTFSSEKTTTHDEWHDSLAIGSSLSGKAVNIVAGNDVAVVGSTVLGQDNVRLAAGNNIIIESAQDTSSEAHSVRQKKSGLTGGTGGGVASVGYSKSSSRP
ncbi:hypothetical protein EYC55_22875 [Xanthomonas oryzae]|uniref:hemagglutinin repeat-containing protein n=1 Tax=Xanthomonas oryzae TaxID=347 RepID=UPI001034E42B|nr:hemagglutinin repeat-containing protein [Xanthomonas oryzae]QBG97655.1 hypothetical protein EYC55_22875 [Xanthomonas oryzae]